MVHGGGIAGEQPRNSSPMHGIEVDRHGEPIRGTPLGGRPEHGGGGDFRRRSDAANSVMSVDRLTSQASQHDDGEDIDEGFSLAGWIRDEYRELLGKYESSRDSINDFMVEHALFFKIEVVNTILSIVSVSLYIAATYMEADDPQLSNNSGIVVPAELVDQLDLVDNAINFFFLVDFILKLFLAKSWLVFFYNWQTAIDLVTIFPSIIFFIVLQTSASGEKNDTARVASQLNFLRVARVLRLTRIIRMQQALNASKGIQTSELSKQLVTESLVMISLIFTFAGTFLVCESEFVDSEVMLDRWGRDRIYFHDALYLTVITIATVGFGDLFPISPPGKLIVACMIITSIVVISRQTNQILALMSVQSEYARAVYVPQSSRSQHVIICGDISFHTAKDFLEEFFHVDHGRRDVTVVFLVDQPPSFDMQFLIRTPEYSSRTVYLEGSCFNDADLLRASAAICQCFFVLTNKFADDNEKQDFSTVMKCLAFKDHLKHNNPLVPEVTTIIQLVRPENKFHFSSSIYGGSKSLQAFCLDEIKLHLLAKSCIIPGFCTLISNLTRSVESDVPRDADEWIKEYAEGSGYEIYRTALSPHFKRMRFGECALEIFNMFGLTLFAIEIQDSNGYPQVVLNPSQYVIPASSRIIHVFILAKDQSDAEKVSLYHLTPGDPEHGRMAAALANKSTNMKNISNSTNEFANVFSALSATEQHEKMKESYHVRNGAASLKNCTIEATLNISDHVLVCGDVSGLQYFIATLRPLYLTRVRPIVILHPSMDEESWKEICLFSDVWFVKGSPLETADLIRAGAHNLEKVAILAMPDEDGADNSDADSVFIFQAIQRINPLAQIVCELVGSGSVSFLNASEQQRENSLPTVVDSPRVWTSRQSFSISASGKMPTMDSVKSGNDDLDKEMEDPRLKTAYFQPAFTAGVVYLSSSLDTMCCQAFFNPCLLSMIRELVLSSGSSKATFPENANVFPSELFCIKVPPGMIGRKYVVLFRHLITQMSAVPLGLYRHNYGGLPYVVTNPPSNLIVSQRDLIYVLRSPKLCSVPNTPPDSPTAGDGSGDSSPSQKSLYDFMGDSDSSMRKKRGSGLRHMLPPLQPGAGQYEKIDESDNELASQSSFHRGASTESRNWSKSNSRPSITNEPPLTDTPEDGTLVSLTPEDGTLESLTPEDGTLAHQSDDDSRRGSQQGTFQQSETAAEAGVTSPRGNPPSARQPTGEAGMGHGEDPARDS